jgi:hypothetical protein
MGEFSFIVGFLAGLRGAPSEAMKYGMGQQRALGRADERRV